MWLIVITYNLIMFLINPTSSQSTSVFVRIYTFSHIFPIGIPCASNHSNYLILTH